MQGHKYEAVRKVLKNTSYLFFFQAANYLFPILLTSYLIRTVGYDIFGKLSYFQNIALYLLVLVNFGFDFSMTKEVALIREDANRLADIVWGGIYLKAALLVVTAAIVLILFPLSDKVNNDPLLYFSSMLILAGYALFPNWYFQGKERMSVISVFNLLIKLPPFLLVIAFVKSPNDAYFMPLFHSLVHVMAGVVGLWWCLKSMGYIVRKFGDVKKNVIAIARKSFPIFLSTVIQSWHSLGNFLVLSWFVTDTQLGYFTIAQRIVLAILIVTQVPFNFALYPHFVKMISESKEKAARYFVKILGITALTGLLISVSLYFFAPTIIYLLVGDYQEESIQALRWLAAVPVFWGITCITNFQGLYAFGFANLSPIVSFVSSVLSFAITYLLVPQLGILAACVGWACGQIAEVLQGVIVLKTKGVLTFVK